MFGIWAKVDIGGHDEIHGETGDDFVYGGGGNDIAFGDADDDDIIGGWGNDWISGGTGIDGILGDDGRIFTSRNTAAYGDSEPLRHAPLLASDPDTRTSQGNVLNEFIYTPGQVQTETINVAGKLKKSVDLTPYRSGAQRGGQADDPLFRPIFADDIIFGGLGDDFLHGGAGDDAMAGGEALPEESYAPRIEGSLRRAGQERDIDGRGAHRLHRPLQPGQRAAVRRRHRRLERAQAGAEPPGRVLPVRRVRSAPHDPVPGDDGSVWKDGRFGAPMTA
jgi:hypothetical protein